MASIKFHYVKTHNAVEMPVHGAFGGINPSSGQVTMAVFSERPAIPTEIEYELSSEGFLGTEVRREGKDGLVRSVGAIMHMDIYTAISLHEWLQSRIEEFKSAHPDFIEEAEK